MVREPRFGEVEKFAKLTPEEMASTGRAVWSRVMGVMPAPEMEDGWVFAAANAKAVIDQAILGNGSLSPEFMAAEVFKCVMKEDNWAILLPKTKLAWEIVVRHWISCLTTEEGHLNVSQAERYSVDWVKKKMQDEAAAANGKAQAAAHVVSGPSNPNWVSSPNESESLPQVQQPPVQAVAPSPQFTGELAYPEKPTGAANGFRNVIQIKINRMKRQIEGLERLKATISQELDGPLFEVFKEVMGK